MNNQIQSYLLQKKELGSDSFSFLTTNPINGIVYQDSGVEVGKTYQYRVASVSFKGDTSKYSEIFNYSLPKERVEVLNDIILTNSHAGIKLILPSVIFANRKAYNIFRRTEQENKFKKIATISANQFSFIDKNVQKGVAYFYSVSITEKDLREGEMGIPVSIRRID
jgi:fibronectin type 3 domain-containing protein